MIRDINELHDQFKSHKPLYIQVEGGNFQEVVMIGYNMNMSGPYSYPKVTVELMMIEKPQNSYNLYYYGGQVHTGYPSPRTFKVDFPCAELFSYNPEAQGEARVDPNDLLKGLIE